MPKVFQILFKRILFFFPLLLIVSFFAFALISSSGANYFTSLKLDPQVSSEMIEKYEKMYNLDQAWHIQYFAWLKSLFSLDMGYSFSQKMPVFSVLKHYFFNTLLLSVSSLVFIWSVSIFLGVLAAVCKDTLIEKTISFILFIFQSVPPFLAALLFIFLFVYLKDHYDIGWINHIAAVGGKKSFDFATMDVFGKTIDLLKHMVIPIMAISLPSIGSLQRIMKNNMLGVLHNNYIKKAKACGIFWHKIIFVYALKNAINPMVTIFGYHLSSIFAGAALVEIICNWPGLGNIMLIAVRSQDIFLVMGGLILSGVMLLVGNLTADMILLYMDPRIDFTHKTRS